jgi:hypothetical protein
MYPLQRILIKVSKVLVLFQNINLIQTLATFGNTKEIL